MKLQSIDMSHTKDITKIGLPYRAYRVARMVSPDERVAAGKALRDKIPRREHSEWKEIAGRPNPIDLLHKSDAGRMKNLVAIRYGWMLQSPFAFYRGSAVVMASDLARMPTTPRQMIWMSCGKIPNLVPAGRPSPRSKETAIARGG